MGASIGKKPTGGRGETRPVMPPKPVRGGGGGLFQPLERATTRGRGGRETQPGYAIGPADRLIPYVNDPRLQGKKLDYSQSPYRNIRNQYSRSNQQSIPRGGVRRRPSGPRIPGGCPDPNMHILMSDGSQKKAGDLQVGDLIKTNHEETLKLGEYKVEYVNILENVEKIKFTFDESVIICSSTHKFYVNDSWKEAKDMVIDDVVSGKKLLAIENVEDGNVVHITVEDAHTYICEGLLSHNKRFAPGKGPRGPRGSRPPRGPRGPKGGIVGTVIGGIRGGAGIGGGPGTPPKFPRGDIGIGGGPGIPPRFPTGGPTSPRPPKNFSAVQETRRVPVKDPTLGGPPEREVPIPRERFRRITRESDPSGPAPFAPDERGVARDRFFERMFDRAEEAKQRKSIQQEERREVRQIRNEERQARRMQPGEIDVGGEIDINAERGGRRRRGGMRRNMRGGRRDFTRRRSRMMGGRRGRSMAERAAFRDRYVSTLGGGFFS